MVEVLEGLEKGAMVVASGAGFLNDGDMVKTVPAPSPVATAAPKPGTPASAL
jgi:hypothetical protein